MEKTQVTLQLDAEVKKQADHLFSELGLDTETAVNIFLHQAIRRGGIPFPIEKHPHPPVGKPPMGPGPRPCKEEKF